MSTAETFKVGGYALPVADGQARARADSALELASMLAAQSIGDDIGRNLAAIFASEILGYSNEWEWLQARTRAANFEGLHIGDYLDLTRTDGEMMRYRIAAIDPYYRCCDVEQGHHIAMVPDETVRVAGTYATGDGYIMWNSTATNQGTAAEKHPYLASRLHQWEKDVFYYLLPEIVRECLMNKRSLEEERYNASSAISTATTFSWCDLGYIWSLNEVEVYGYPIWGTRGYSDALGSHFPLFAQCKDRIRDVNGGRVYWWLRVPGGASSSTVCYVHGNGLGTAGSAASTAIRPLPCFLIG